MQYYYPFSSKKRQNLTKKHDFYLKNDKTTFYSLRKRFNDTNKNKVVISINTTLSFDVITFKNKNTSYTYNLFLNMFYPSFNCFITPPINYGI